MTGRRLQLLLVGLLILISGFVHGNWTDRWSRSTELDSALARMDRVPARIGVWEGRDIELDPRQAAHAGVERCLGRRFENARDHSVFTVLLMCGRSGPISVHSPDVCYQGAGYVMDGPPVRRQALQGDDAELFVGKFNKTDGPLTRHLRIYWAWLGDDCWRAPDSPRKEFAGRRALYKLYVIRELARADEKLDDEASSQFLAELLPALTPALRAQN